jgi:hypothetical protein
MNNASISILLDTTFILIILIGFLSNLTNIVIFGQKNMRKQPTFRFLLHLSVIDLFVILICAIDSFLTYGFNIQIRLHSIFICKIHTFFTYFLSHMSSIILMIVSIDRVLVIWEKPLKYFSTNYIEKFVLLTATVCFLINSHYIYFFSLDEMNKQETLIYNYYINTSIADNASLTTVYNLNTQYDDLNNLGYLRKDIDIGDEYSSSDALHLYQMKLSYLCFPKESPQYNYFLNNIWSWVDNSIYSFLPLSIMLICSVLIFVQIKKTSNRILSRINQNLYNRSIIQNRMKRNNKILFMLISTNLFFIFCTLPYTISNCRIFNTSYFALYLVHILAYSNNSFNFAFYIIFSEKYRFELIRLITLFFKKSSKNSILLLNDNQIKTDHKRNYKIAEDNQNKFLCIDAQFASNFKSLTYEEFNLIQETAITD